MAGTRVVFHFMLDVASSFSIRNVWYACPSQSALSLCCLLATSSPSPHCSSPIDNPNGPSPEKGIATRVHRARTVNCLGQSTRVAIPFSGNALPPSPFRPSPFLPPPLTAIATLARVRGLRDCRQRLEYGSSLCRQSINVSEPGLGLVSVSRLLLSIKGKEEICVPWSGTATAWSAAPVVAAALATVAWKSQG